MSEQNKYRIERNYKNEQGWSGWTPVDTWSGDTWQDAIQHRLDDDNFGMAGTYKSVSETPSEDGRSGIIEILIDPGCYDIKAKIRATLIKD